MWDEVEVGNAGSKLNVEENDETPIRRSLPGKRGTAKTIRLCPRHSFKSAGVAEQ
jgi:hypothetical protein